MASFVRCFPRAALVTGRIQAAATPRNLASFTHGSGFYRNSIFTSAIILDQRFESLSTLADEKRVSSTPKASSPLNTETLDQEYPESQFVGYGSTVAAVPPKPLDLRELDEIDDDVVDVRLNSDPPLRIEEEEPQPPPHRAMQRNRRLRQPRAASPWSTRFYSPPSRRRNRYQRNNHMDSLSAIITPVESVHIAQSINLEKVFQNVFPERRPRLKFPSTNYFVVRLGSIHRPRYVAVFGYGSVVFFDIAPKDVENLLREIKQYGTDVNPAGSERREIFKVEIQPQLQGVAHVVNGDLCVVPALDMDCVAVIANIMAQTVALDAYSRTVENLLQVFANINSKVTQNGSFTELEKNTLFRTVAQNNSIVIDLISKLGIKDRSDTAWNLSQYEQVHAGLKEEFEIDNRFDLIEFKLNLIQQNAKFFLEVLHHQKANTLEWIIVVLIAFECSLMMLEMSGYGKTLFQALTQQ